MNESIFSLKKDFLVAIAWILTVVMGVGFGMFLYLVPETEGLLVLYRYFIAGATLVCAIIIEIIMIVGLKGWDIKAVKKDM